MTRMPPFPFDSVASTAGEKSPVAELASSAEPRTVIVATRPARSAARRAGSAASAERGKVAFAEDGEVAAQTAELRERGFVVVRVPALPAVLKGHLAEHIDERIERELSARGAPSPCMSAWGAMPGEVQERLADQLFRARGLGARGLGLLLGTLGGDGSSLDPEDSATLRRLVHLSAEAPVVVLLAGVDRELPAFAAPIPLATLLACDAEADAPSATPIDAASSVAQVAPSHEPASERTNHANGGPERPRAARAVTAGITESGPSDFWRTWALSLGAARGPQPLAALEKLFTESYMPLANAIAAGLDDPRALRAHDEFRRSFERTYTDAFATFGVTGRRPRLVMDAYDFAAKQARAHEARAGQVLVIDSLRYDLGQHMRDAIATRAGGFATLVGETLHWSALPTTTFRQLETLARGADALRDPMVEEPSESLRGRAAENVRRLRVGSRELYKLDLVPSLLASVSDAGPRASSDRVVSAFDDIADAVADAIARHFAAAPPRTLVVVTGDHGFSIDRRGHVTSGGASPEEVLVPAFAYVTSPAQ